MRDLVKALIVGLVQVESEKDSARQVFKEELEKRNKESLADAAKKAREKRWSK